MTRWRCRNERCERRIFAERIPGLARHLRAEPRALRALCAFSVIALVDARQNG